MSLYITGNYYNFNFAFLILCSKAWWTKLEFNFNSNPSSVVPGPWTSMDPKIKVNQPL